METGIKTKRLKLDRIFSEFIRRSRSKDGIAVCFTCGKIDSWNNMDCGHFIKRQNLATRYNEINCQIQCRACNWLKQGNDVIFEKNLRAKYGDDKIDFLKSVKSKKIHGFEFDVLIEKYQQLLMEIK